MDEQDRLRAVGQQVAKWREELTSLKELRAQCEQLELSETGKSIRLVEIERERAAEQIEKILFAD